MENTQTTISISKGTRANLEKVKEYPRETIDHLIERLIERESQNGKGVSD
jgi:hypothetical protein